MKRFFHFAQVVSYLFKLVCFFPWAMCARFVSGLIWAFVTSVQPYLLKNMIDRLTQCDRGEIFSVLWQPGLLYLLSYLILSLGFLLHTYAIDVHMVPRLRKMIAKGSLDQLLTKPYRFYKDHFSGSISNRINDLTRSSPDMLELMDRFYSHVLAFFIALFFLWSVSGFFAVMTLVWSLGFLLCLFYFGSRLAEYSTHWASCGSELTGQYVDLLTNILSVRLFSSERSEKKFVYHSMDRAVKAEQRLHRAYFQMWGIFDFSFCFLQVLNVYLLCLGVKNEWLSPGDFALVLVLNGSLAQVLYRLSREFSKFSKLYGQMRQALSLIENHDQEIKESKTLKDLMVKKGSIIFDRVVFFYESGGCLFDNKSVEILPGQKVGLVGYSGAGKSTFVNLILGLYDLNDGCILIDGQDISSVTKSSLRESVSMIPQDPSLFHRSLMENIRYGYPDASDKMVISAAKKAHAHDFIINLPEGYDTHVGDRGVKLSGGQRQRIVIARAILKNAPILIMDEATSQLDSQSEALIQESLWQLMKQKTSIVIAHRLSTLLHMDRILVFDGGMITEDGTHKELLSQKGQYKDLWDRQVSGFLPNDD